MFLLKISHNKRDFGKWLSSNLKNVFTMIVLMVWKNGGLNHVIFLVLFLTVVLLDFLWVSGFELSLHTWQIATWILSLVIMITKLLIIQKKRKQFLYQGKLNSFTYFSTLYSYFIDPLHTIIKRNIAYTQNEIAKYRKSLAIFTKIFACCRLKTSLHSAYLLQSGFQRIIQSPSI